MVLSMIDDWIERKEKHYICLCTVHGIMECQSDPELKKIFNRSGLTTPDGMPLVFLSRLSGKRWVDRVYGPDLLLALCHHSQSKGYRHFFYGGEEGVAERLVQRLTNLFPKLEVCGTFTPPFRPLTEEEDQQVISAINLARPDIVWVGLSTPKQERWMAGHIDRLQAPVLIGIGAAFDFISQRKPQAPRWIQRSGLEWLFRLLNEPRRLAFRYLIYNPLFLLLLIKEKAGL